MNPMNSDELKIFCAAINAMSRSAVLSLNEEGNAQAAVEFVVSFAEAVVDEVRKRGIGDY